MATVRQRNNTTKQEEEEEVAGLLRNIISTSGGRDSSHYQDISAPTVSSLLERSSPHTNNDNRVDPTFSGYMHKRGYRFGNVLACCPSCCGCRPVWKKRFFVIRGGYLFRFTSNTRTARPKGTPVPLMDATFTAVHHHHHDDNDKDANPHEDVLLSVSTIRKEYMFRTDTVERRNEWIRKLRTAKQIAIKVRLGHAKQSTVDKRAREAGERMFNDGIRRERQALDHETEMRNLSGMGGY